jgi:hypothetical protein
MADSTPQAERSRRWRAGIAQRLAAIELELRELGDQISRELAVVTAQLAGQERRAGLHRAHYPLAQIRRIRSCHPRLASPTQQSV